MSTATTRAEAVRRLRESGRLSKLRLTVAEEVLNAGEPVTANELHQSLASRGAVVNKPSVTPRLIELVRQEVVREVGIRECRVSGYRCVTYEATGRDPVELKHKRPRPETPEQRRIRLLEGEVASLRAKLSRWGRPSKLVRAERIANSFTSRAPAFRFAAEEQDNECTTPPPAEHAESDPTPAPDHPAREHPLAVGSPRNEGTER